jgi:hypothetical protein
MTAWPAVALTKVLPAVLRRASKVALRTPVVE